MCFCLKPSVFNFKVKDSYEIACFKSFIRKTSRNIIANKYIFKKSLLCSIRIYIFIFLRPVVFEKVEPKIWFSFVRYTSIKR